MVQTTGIVSDENNLFSFVLVVLVTFGHPWLRHSSHPERAMVPTDVVRVSELVVCTLRLSVRVFTPLPDGGEKTQNPLVPESFGNFWKHAPLYNRRFFRYWGGGGEGFYIRLWCGGKGMRSDHHSFPSDGCDALWKSGLGLYTWPVRKPWWSNPRHRLTPVARCFTGLSLPHPPKPLMQTDWQTY
jgi:hypothetical protein